MKILIKKKVTIQIVNVTFNDKNKNYTGTNFIINFN